MNIFEDIIVMKLVAYRNASINASFDNLPEREEDDQSYLTYNDLMNTLEKFKKLTPDVEVLIEEFVNSSWGHEDNHFLREVVEELCDALEIDKDYVDIICKGGVNEPVKKVNEEIDLGWEIDARRHDAEQRIRWREKWNNDIIIYNGKEENRGRLIRRLRAMISDYEDLGYDVEPITKLIYDVQDMEPGDEAEFPKLRKIEDVKSESGKTMKKKTNIKKESNHLGDWCNCPNCGERIGWDDYDDEVTCDGCGETFDVSELASDEDEGDEEDVKSESKETTDTNPKICLTTYRKYNDGTSIGEWIDLTEFSDYEDFVEHCHEVHSDDPDPEFMVVDFEYYPKAWYHESGLPTEEEFNNIQELSNLSDNEKEAYSAYLSLSPSDESIDAFRDAYHGEYTSDSDLGYEMIDQAGMPEHPDYYFDMEKFGRDLKMDFTLGDPDEMDADGEPQDPDWYYDSDGYRQFEDGDDAQIAEEYIDGLGGVEQLGQETIQRYFDYGQFGRELRLNDFNEVDGYLFWM